MALPIRQLNSQVSYLADGVTTVWDFSFAGGYIDKAHVFAQKLNPLTGAVTDIPISVGAWIGPFQLSLSPPVENGYELTIYRNTPKDVPLVDFTDKANLTEASLDLNARQAIFVAAESSDGLNVAIDSVSEIVNYVESARVYSEAADADAAAALVSKNQAAASASAANTSAINASGFATNAGNSATAAATSASEALAYRNTASTHATTASTQAGNASTSATNAAASALAASNSATSAGNSATTASGHATTATNKATEASNSAADALEYRDQTQAIADTIEAGAVLSVAARTGHVVLTKDDVGLSLADNLPQVWERIADVVPTASAIISFALPTTHRLFRIYGIGLKPPSGSPTNNLWGQVSIAGTYRNGASDYHTQRITHSGATVAAAGALENVLALSSGGNQATPEKTEFELTLMPGDAGMRGCALVLSRGLRNDGQRQGYFGTQEILVVGRADGFRLGWLDGAVFQTTGRIIIEGLRA
jgi:hypothetical protein